MGKAIRFLKLETANISSSSAEKKEPAATSMKLITVDAAQTRATQSRIQQAKNHAVSQAQQEGSTGNFKIFDSPYGNFLVPVTPTRAELGGKGAQ